MFRDRAHPQRGAVEECPPGAVLVMDSRKNARAASGGAILVTRLMERGGGRRRHRRRLSRLGRDCGARRSRPTTTARAPTNLTLHQALEINVPIGCGDAPVFPGDVVLGDSEASS